MPVLPPRIVITGAPGSAKTLFFDRLRTEHIFEDFLFFEEVARKLLVENPELRQNRLEFHRRIYEVQNRQEQHAGERPFVTDRGTVDAYAFHPDALRAVGSSLEKEYERYTTVIMLGTAAQLGPDHYRTDEIRTESIADALEIDRAITTAWRAHPGYLFVRPEIDIEKKYRIFLEAVVNAVSPELIQRTIL